jgi:hypothetical protein
MQPKTPDQYKEAYKYHKQQGNKQEAARVAQLYRQHLAQQPQVAPKDRDSAFEYSIDQAQKMYGGAVQNVGRLINNPSIEQYGKQVSDQQDKDIEKGGYQSQYSTARDSFNKEGLPGVFKWAAEGVQENAVSGGASLVGAAGTALAAYLGAPVWAVGALGTLTLGNSIALNTGDNVLEQQEKTGDFDERVATGVGVIAGILDRIGAGRAIPKPDLAKMTTEEVIGELMKQGKKKAAVEFAKRIGAEGVTETAQEALNMGGTSLVGGQYTSEEVADRLTDSFLLGSAQSGVMNTGIKAVQGTANIASKFSPKSGAAAAKMVRTNSDNIRTSDDLEAAASLAQRLASISDANEYDLEDIEKMSTTGARETVDKAHVQYTEELKQLFKDLKDRVKVNDQDSLQEIVDKILAEAAYREGRNKTKNTVGRQEMDALERLAGDTFEGQQALNILKQLNQLTQIHNNGYQGGVSQITDQFSPFGSSVGYDRGAVATERLLRPIVSGSAALSTGGASLLGQLAAQGTGRMIDKVTGNRSKVRKYIEENQGGQPLSTPNAPSLRMQKIAEAQAAQEAEMAAQAAAEQRAADKRESNLKSVRNNDPANPGSPQGIVELGTALDRNGVAQVLRIMKGNPNTTAYERKMIEDYETSVATGGYIDYDIVRKINGIVDNNPQLKPLMGNRVRNQGAVNQAAQQQLSQKDANYQRGIENNKAFAQQLQDALAQDSSVLPIHKAHLGEALNQMQLDLGAAPVKRLKAIEDRLAEKGVPTEAAAKYFAPYVERVVAQQEAKADRDATAAALDEDPINDARIVPVPRGNERMQQIFGVNEPGEGGNYIDLDSKEDLTGNTYTGGVVKIIDGKPLLETNDAPATPATKESGNKVKVNLFKQKAGWKWIDYDGPETIVSTHQGSKHHYSLSSDFETPVTLQTYPKQPSEPRLRPTSQGKVVLGNKIGSISVRGKVHPVYDQVTIVDKRDQEDPVNDSKDIARSKYKPPRRQKSGKYIGAPRGINTPAKLKRIRTYVKELAKQGKYGRFWYERSGEIVLAITGGNVEEAKKLVRAIAITSPSTPVDTNFEYAIQAYYQWKNGQPIETGRFPASMGRKITDVFEGRDWSGRKTNNFENNLLRAIDGSLEQGVTTDLWMMRAFGYPSDAATDLNYDFVENETYKIAEELGWEPQQVQAAIWVEIKSRMESPEVKSKVDRLSEKRGNYKWVKDKKGKKIREFASLEKEQAHGKLWVETALKYDPTEAERGAAKFDYQDAALTKMAQISVESIPSTNSGHFPEIFDAPVEQIIEYHHAIDKAFLDDDGYDIVAKELGMLQLGVSTGLGSWEGRNDPVSQNEVIVPRQYRVKEDGVISDDAKDLINAYVATKGILLKQDAIGWHRPFFKKSNTRKAQDGIDVNIGRPFSLRETQEISQALSEYGIEPISTATGVRFINFSDDQGSFYSGLDNYKPGKSNMDFEKAVNNALEMITFDNAETANAKRFVSDNGLTENNWQENQNGEGYLDNRLRERPDLQGRVTDIIKKLQPRIREVETEFSEKYGWSPNTGLNTAYNDQEDQVVPSLSGPGVLSQSDPVNNSVEAAFARVQRDYLEPTPTEIKEKLPEAEDLVQFTIGKKGSSYEEGITSEADIRRIADLLDITISIVNEKGAIPGVISADSRGNYAGKRRGTRGEINVRGPKVVGKSQYIATLLHEVSHGLEGQTLDGEEANYNYAPSPHPKGSKKFNADTFRHGSFREHMHYVLKLAKGDDIYGEYQPDVSHLTLPDYDEAVEIRKEIDAIQADGTGMRFPGFAPGALNTDNLLVRPPIENYIEEEARREAEILSGQKSGPDFDTRFKKSKTGMMKNVGRPFIRYTKDVAEFSVDPLIVYLQDPQMMKLIAPTTSKYIQKVYNKANMPVKFYSSPLVAVLAILLAGLAKGMGGEEEEQQPGALSMQPGLLTT